MAIVASERMRKYFDVIQQQVQEAHDAASAARKSGYDPSLSVEVKMAKNLAERVVGLISVVAPQVVGTKIVDRIVDLEDKYGSQDWRVAMVIAYEVAQQQYCTFKDEIEAIEVGIRVGFAYVTVGVVSSPLEGFTKLEIRDRRDGKGKYFCMHFAGPIRNAGGTAAATSVIIADYVRKKMGYAKYDPDEKECERCHVEIMDYHDRITNLQYVPSKGEVQFMVSNCPIEINGDASEKFEVSNCKDLPRVHTNFLRSGFCLIHSSCLPLKAPKLWKNLSRWYKDFEMEDWKFLEEFIHIQHEAKAKGGKSSAGTEVKKVSPVYTYIADLVGGRPVISHPLRSGGLRLRYGRSRTSGLSAQSMHPATTYILDKFVAIGTQLKVERPGKAAAITTCDTIEGPRVLLKNGDIIYVDSVELAKKITNDVKEILYVGDVLVNYGDFFDRAHPLVPCGYCEEWWAVELEKVCVDDVRSALVAEVSNVDELISNPLHVKPTYAQAVIISKIAKVPLHPNYIYFYREISCEKLRYLLSSLRSAKDRTVDYDTALHEMLGILGVPITVRSGKIIFAEQEFTVLQDTLKDIPVDFGSVQDTLHLINLYAPFKIRDKSGTFIGARMGRPEKGKPRKLSTSPHGLFPVADQGGRLRSFQSCIEHGYVEADCAVYMDAATNTLTPLAVSHVNDQPNKKVFVDIRGSVCDEKDPGARTHCTVRVPFPDVYRYCIKKLGMAVGPDIVKGVQGTVNSDHYVEHPAKAILRSHYGLFVNKDGTMRYDASEIPITHFKPKEVRVPVKRLRELGYVLDIHGKDLVSDDQVLELIPQDILLPCCPESGNQPADEMLFNATKFIDDLLVKLYGVKPFFNCKTPDDLVGHLVVGLAPHTSAGTVGRIIGFTQAQGMYCHPLFHSANRRDCDGDELCYLLLLDAFLNFSTHYLPSSRGGTMDAPLVLTSVLDPTEVDDMAFNLDVAWKYPLEFYEAASAFKNPWDVKVDMLKNHLHTDRQLESMGFTHDTSDINDGVLCSAYKILPSMADKVKGQMALAVKIRAVDHDDVARIVVQTHFIRDTKGNLRKYSMQEFRCVKCNTKYRRPPLVGICSQAGCHGKILFTISQGSIVKYLEPSILLAEQYHLPKFLAQSLELTKLHIEGIFGKEKEKQMGLDDWI